MMGITDDRYQLIRLRPSMTDLPPLSSTENNYQKKGYQHPTQTNRQSYPSLIATLTTFVLCVNRVESLRQWCQDVLHNYLFEKDLQTSLPCFVVPFEKGFPENFDYPVCLFLCLSFGVSAHFFVNGRNVRKRT